MPPTDSSPPLYASFLRRVQALQVDAIVLMLALAVAVVAAMQVKSDAIGRVIGFLLAAFILVYEPLFVSLRGGTPGHLQRNLHVVDERTGGRLSPAKAVLRSIVKFAFGWVSFLSMLFTRRSQALHDIVTGSTVRIRDPTVARSSDFVAERRPGSVLRGRSRWRVLAVTIAWLLVVFAIFMTALFLLVQGGLVSWTCIDSDRCTRTENLWVEAAFWISFLTMVGIIFLAWRGSLPGCRVRRA